MQRSRTRKLARARIGRRAARATKLLRHAPVAAAIMAAMHAARAQEDTTALAEVVVTAEKRAENLQDVPISITALDTKKLEELNLQHFTDYAQALPTVSFQTLEPGFSNLYMRGIVGDANTNHSGPLPSVGTYLDEQPITTIQGSLDLHIYDIARIEVLPGPQGTLYGASSEAGTLRIITNKPDPTGFKAGYDLQANTIRNGTAGGIAEGFVNLPLSSKAALRLVGWYERDSGNIDNFDLTYAGAYLKRTDHTCSDYSDYSLGYDAYASYWPANPTQLIFGKDRYQMYSNELRLSSPKDYPVRFVAGLFQQRQQHSIEQRYVINGLNTAFWIGAGGPNAWPDTWWLTEQVRVNRDAAVFGELNWDITSKLTATGGFRHFTYKNTLEGFYGFGIGGFSTPGSGTSGEGICFRNTPFHGAPCVDLDKRSDGSGWTPKLNLAYKFDPHRMVYATFSKGFRPGGVNRVGTAEPYGADFLKNYEVGR